MEEEEKLEEYRQAFELLDPTDEGSVTKEKLEQFLWALGHRPTHTEVCYIVADATQGSSLKIYFRGFLHLAKELTTPEDEEKELLETFRIFDKNRDGYIGASDLRFVLSRLGREITEEEADHMINEVDLDGDGRISFKEFVEALEHN
ncbi:calmodulin [Elysia marginata]|uniref:Calmodulin n=1 Tax=Elysia marginata TaxID=1093978 RepID=A0AAV4EHK0_9GAST|nr:calmodulin [Elysia marginata]